MVAGRDGAKTEHVQKRLRENRTRRNQRVFRAFGAGGGGFGIGLCELLADVCGGALHDGRNADDARGSAENVLLLQQAQQIIELKDEIIANKEQVIAALRHEIEWLNEKIARLQSCDRPKSSLHSDIFLKDNVL